MLTKQEHALQLFDKWVNSEYYQDKLDKRLKIQDASSRKTGQILSYQLAREDILFWINNFVWFSDPRPEFKIHNLPAILFDYQEEFVLWIKKKIETGEDGLVEKSRDMGVTWLMVVVFVWFWLFSDSFSGLLGSYKEAYVDNKTLDSLFGKVDYIIRNLPKWMLPKRFNINKHRINMRLTNPESLNVITGDTMNPNFGRGSRKTAIFFDEGAFWDYFLQAWDGTSYTTSCKLVVSTPNGRNAFAILRESGRVDVKTIHWTSHPFKDQKWYEFQKSIRTPEEIAQELDISYSKSQEGRVYPEWDKVEVGDFPYNSMLPLYVSWDFGKEDDNAIVWWQSEPNGKVRLIDCFSRHGKLIDFYVPFITGVTPSSPEYTKRELSIIDSHKDWKSATHFGDPAGRFTNQVINKSVIDILQEYGIKVNFKEEAKDFPTRKTETKLLLRRLVINDNDNTKEIRAAMEDAHYPRQRQGGSYETKTISPVHNWSSHYRSAVEYFAVNFNKLKGQGHREIKDKFNFSKRVGY